MNFSWEEADIKEGENSFNNGEENNIKGFSDNPLLLGIESRSSSPIRIKRNELFE